MRKTDTIKHTGGFGKLTGILSDIKLAHTVFALPFALASAHIAFAGKYDLKILGLILLCMFTARSAAMAFNRWLDRDIDTLNPRTKDRTIPSGKVSPNEMMAFIIICCLFFMISAWFLNLLAFLLSPLALVIVLGYSYFKRFTSLSHLVLGLSLAIAPVGAWIAVRGEFALLPIILALTVIFWVAGFDIMYACQDMEFDKSMGLHSIPQRFGINAALMLSTLSHVITIGLMVWFGHLAEMGFLYMVIIGVISLILLIEHTLVTPNKLNLIGVAFFTLNGVVSIFFYLAVLFDSLLTGSRI